MEKWKKVKNYEDYEVSTIGRARSTKNGSVRMLKKRLNVDGYVKVTFTVNAIAHDFTIHRLVAKTFIPNPNGYETVNHKNGNKEDNRVENLEWMDRHKQLVHAYEHNLKKPMRGVRNPNSKLTDEDVREIKRVYIKNSKEFGSIALAREYNVNAGNIRKIIRGETYKDIV